MNMIFRCYVRSGHCAFEHCQHKPCDPGAAGVVRSRDKAAAMKANIAWPHDHGMTSIIIVNALPRQGLVVPAAVTVTCTRPTVSCSECGVDFP